MNIRIYSFQRNDTNIIQAMRDPVVTRFLVSFPIFKKSVKCAIKNENAAPLESSGDLERVL